MAIVYTSHYRHHWDFGFGQVLRVWMDLVDDGRRPGAMGVNIRISV